MARWVRANLGKETPLHFSGFTPMYKMRHLPPTSLQTLEAARDIATAKVWSTSTSAIARAKTARTPTVPECRKLLIQRVGYHACCRIGLKDGHCPDCGKEIYGVWK